LDEEAARGVAQKIKKLGIKNVAIGFINSYKEGKHERKMREILQEEIPGVSVSISSEVLPKIRCLGRFTATILNAALKPVVGQYLERLETELQKAGFKGILYIIESNGGMMEALLIKNWPERILMSGPSAGAIGGSYVGELTGYENVITADMGGTSFDVSTVEKGEPQITTDYSVGWDMPVPVPTVDIVTLGAGGGTIAWVDSGGALRVGPQSAGADPGPLCYNKGGTEPTVTDANLVLGYLNPDNFLGGEIKLDLEKAKRGIRNLGERIGLGIMETAEGIITIVNENMARGLREVTIDRGKNPRDFVLVAFGGAGPLHAASLAKIVGIPIVIIPPQPGVLSAFGATIMDVRHDLETTFCSSMNGLNINALNAQYEKLDKKGVEILKKEGFRKEDLIIRHFAEMRYEGQTYEIEVEMPSLKISRKDLKQIEANFHSEHEKRYLVCDPSAPVEFVNIRSTIMKKVERTKLFSLGKKKEGKGGGALKGTRGAYFMGAWLKTPVYDREKLKSGDTISGPAIVEQEKATTLILPGMRAHIDTFGNIIITITGG